MDRVGRGAVAPSRGRGAAARLGRVYTHLLAATGVLTLLTLVPGPDMAIVTKRAVSRGRADGLRTVGGICVGLLLWGALTVAGLAALLAASAEVYLVVKLAGRRLPLLPRRPVAASRRLPSRPYGANGRNGAGRAPGAPAWSATR